jgi:hypothetical protein
MFGEFEKIAGYAFRALAMRALLILGALVFAEPAFAEPITLECDLPGAGTPGVEIGWGAAWHGLLLIDNSWVIDDYSFYKRSGSSSMEISRSSGIITQQDGGHRRTGSCRPVSKENRRF